MSWLVVSDFINEDQHEVGTCGPSNISDEKLRRLQAGEGTLQRHYDDDKIPYFEIRVLGGDDFQALDDFSMPGYGCTQVKYQTKEGKWEYL